MQILERINIRQDAAGGGVVLQVVEHAVHLVEFALGILVLDAELIAVGLADRAGLVGPLVPDVAAQVVDVVRLLLPDPQQLVHGGLPVGAPQRQQRELPGQVVAVDDAELLDRVCRGTVVLPAGAHGLIGIPDAVLQNVAAVADKDLVCVAHRSAPFKNTLKQQFTIPPPGLQTTNGENGTRPGYLTIGTKLLDKFVQIARGI